MKNLSSHLIGGLIALAIPIIIFCFCSCEEVKKTDDFYRNIKAVVVAKGGYSEKNGKANNLGNSLLIRSVSDTNLYTELTGHNWSGLNNNFGNKLFWVKNVGDTLSFKFIKRDRWWRMDKPIVNTTSQLTLLKTNLAIQDSILKETELRVNKLIDVSEDLVKHAKRLEQERDSLYKIIRKFESK